MTSVVCLLRGVNVGGHHKIRMAELKVIFETLGFENVQTYIQSGNIVFDTIERSEEKLARCISVAIDKKWGFCPEVVLRTSTEMRQIVKNNPFATEVFDPAKLAVFFLARDPGNAARKAVSSIAASPEILKPVGKEIYIYFPDGQGKSKLKFNVVERAIGNIAWTARNWNTVLTLLKMSHGE